MTPAPADLTLALELADLADALTMPRVGAADLEVDTKPDDTPVTESDRAVEQAIRGRLAEVRPDDRVVGEEYGGSDPVGAGRRWIIDPIDGTKSYMRAMPTWSTLIALVVDGVVEVGVVSMPALERRWWAVRGGGAFANGRRIHVSAIAQLADAHVAWSAIEDWDAIGRPEAILELCRRAWRSRGVGDAWQYMLVAEGAVEVALDPQVSVWDMAPLQVIIEEAGGRFTDLGGVATVDGGDGVATNGLIHDEVLAIVGR